jgi:Transposase
LLETIGPKTTTTHVMDADGARLASRRLPEGLPGIGGFHELVAAHVAEPGQVVIGIETDRGLWVQALGAAGYQVYAVNPLAVARYRDRHQVSGAKSDAGDAKVLADLVRTDRHNHRPDGRGQRGGRGGQGPRPGTPEPDLGPHPAHQRTAFGTARVLPGRAGGVRGPARPRCPGRSGPRSHSRQLHI